MYPSLTVTVVEEASTLREFIATLGEDAPGGGKSPTPSSTAHFHGPSATKCALDPGKVRDEATFIDSYRFALGIPYVMVNGESVVDSREHCGALPEKRP